MANLVSLCHDIEQFLEHNDKDSRRQFVDWLKDRFRLTHDDAASPSNSKRSLPDKSVINTSQIFHCACGHRYSLRFSIGDLLASEQNEECPSGDTVKNTIGIDEHTSARPDPSCSSACKRFKINDGQNDARSASKLLICTRCQIRLHTRETYLQHYSMHQQGFTFCKRCFQFYPCQADGSELHDCERAKADRSNKNETENSASVSVETKVDELHSLEQLIPPDTLDQQDSTIEGRHHGRMEMDRLSRSLSRVEYMRDHETSSSARLTHFGLPKLTDSIIEVIQPDGKRQFRCPLCFNSYVNRSGLNRHYITHSSQDLWKVGQ